MGWVVVTMGQHLTCPLCGHEFERVLADWERHTECPDCIKEFAVKTRRGVRYVEAVLYKVASEPDRGRY